MIDKCLLPHTVTNILKSIPEADAAYIGLSTGDFVGLAHRAGTHSSGLVVQVRQASSSYGDHVVNFEATADATGTSLVRSQVVATEYGAFNSAVRCDCCLLGTADWVTCVSDLGTQRGSNVVESMAHTQGMLA